MQKICRAAVLPGYFAFLSIAFSWLLKYYYKNTSVNGGTSMHRPDEVFYHDHGDGIIHCHEAKPCDNISEHEEYEHPHHNHSHSHTQSKAVINRLSRAIGHLESVKRMVEDERDCTDVLIQLAAVRSALSSTARVILKDHLEHCISDAVETGDDTFIEELNTAIDKYIN